MEGGQAADIPSNLSSIASASRNPSSPPHFSVHAKVLVLPVDVPLVELRPQGRRHCLGPLRFPSTHPELSSGLLHFRAGRKVEPGWGVAES
jgi:hypothetical protein